MAESSHDDLQQHHRMMVMVVADITFTLYLTMLQGMQIFCHASIVLFG